MGTLASTWKPGRSFSVRPGQGARETSLASEMGKSKDKKGQESGSPEGQRDGVDSDARSKSKEFGCQRDTVNSSKLKVRVWWWELEKVVSPRREPGTSTHISGCR